MLGGAVGTATVLTPGSLFKKPKIFSNGEEAGAGAGTVTFWVRAGAGTEAGAGAGTVTFWAGAGAGAGAGVASFIKLVKIFETADTASGSLVNCFALSVAIGRDGVGSDS